MYCNAVSAAIISFGQHVFLICLCRQTAVADPSLRDSKPTCTCHRLLCISSAGRLDAIEIFDREQQRADLCLAFQAGVQQNGIKWRTPAASNSKHHDGALSEGMQLALLPAAFDSFLPALILTTPKKTPAADTALQYITSSCDHTYYFHAPICICICDSAPRAAHPCQWLIACKLGGITPRFCPLAFCKRQGNATNYNGYYPTFTFFNLQAHTVALTETTKPAPQRGSNMSGPMYFVLSCTYNVLCCVASYSPVLYLVVISITSNYNL